MQITLSVEIPEIYRMLKHINLGQKKSLNFGFFGLSTICLIMAVMTLFDVTIPIKGFYFFSILPVLYFIVLPFVFIFQAKNIARQKIFKLPLKYKFSNEGIELITNDSKEFIHWGRFYKVFETSHDFIFYISKTQAFVIPKKKIHQKVSSVRKFIQYNSVLRN